MDNIDKELSWILQKTGERILGDYCDVFFELFEDLEIAEYHPPVPYEVLKGIALAFANASGYPVVLQATLVESMEGQPNNYRTVGHRNVLSADPSHPKAEPPESSLSGL